MSGLSGQFNTSSPPVSTVCCSQLLDTVACHHIDSRRGLKLPDFQKALDAVLARQHRIHEGDVVMRFRKCLHRFLAAIDNVGPVPLKRKEFAKRQGMIDIVIDDQNA